MFGENLERVFAGAERQLRYGPLLGEVGLRFRVEILPQVALIQRYLTGRTFWIKHFGEASTHRPVRAGVQQGSLLGLELCILLTSDLPRLPPTNG